jgi:hypothetical protein
MLGLLMEALVGLAAAGRALYQSAALEAHVVNQVAQVLNRLVLDLRSSTDTEISPGAFSSFNYAIPWGPDGSVTDEAGRPVFQRDVDYVVSGTTLYRKERQYMRTAVLSYMVAKKAVLPGVESFSVSNPDSGHFVVVKLTVGVARPNGGKFRHAAERWVYVPP